MSESKTGAFDALLADIQGQSAEADVMAKAVTNDDAKIEAAAAEGAEDGAEGAEGEGKKPGDEDEVLGKALKIIGADGAEIEGYDGTELIKSLVGRVETAESDTRTALEAVVGLLTKQGALIKSLSEQVVNLGARGAGRRSVITVAEKPGPSSELSKALGGDGAGEADGMPKEEFLAKALQAAELGMIGYRDANLAETYINKGAAPPANVLAAVAKLKAKEA